MKKTSVIGLGGGGTRVIEELRNTFPELQDLISLDLDSEVFNDFFMGYCADVYPNVQQWPYFSSTDLLESWFDSRGFYSPLRELPDIFARCTTRPVMRAAFLMHFDRIRNHLKEVLNSPELAFIVCQTNGSTGSAWILDTAEIVQDLFPNARVRIVLLDGRGDYFGSVASIRHLSNSFWTIREITSHKQFSNDSHLFQTSLEASEFLSRQLREIENQDPSSKIKDIAAFQSGCAQEIYLLVRPMELGRFLDGRCRPISKLITESSRYLLAGLLVAHAEYRVTRDTGRMSWDFLQIAARDSDKHFRITVPKIESPGASLISLALTDPGFGGDEQVGSLAALQNEGRSALYDDLVNLDNECISELQEIYAQTVQWFESLARMSELIPPESRFIRDIYPVLLELLETLLRRHQK